MNGYNPFFNPYAGTLQPFQQQSTLAPQQVVRVNGENGARAFQIGANSSALLLDESGLMVWLVTTDGAGYKTVAPYDIVPHQAAPAPDYEALEERIKRLEETVNANARNISSARKNESNDAVNPKYDGNDQRIRRSAGHAEPNDDE